MSIHVERLDAAILSWFAALAGPGEAASPAAGEERDVERLVEAARRGDRAAGTALYQRHVRAVFRAVRVLVRDEAEAEDVVQEAFVRSLAALEGYRPQPGARFVSWVAAIGLNVARQRARWWRRAVHDGEEAARRSAEEAGGAAPDPGEQLDLARRKRALLEALRELEPREREVVSLRYGAELSAAEVGAALGLREANVRKICERQRKRLLERLGEKTKESEP